MGGNGARRRPAGLLIAAALLLGNCAGHHASLSDGGEAPGGVNAFPQNYKSDVLAAMHAYLNDPTGIRDASISQPMFKPIANGTRYIVCLRFNGKQDNGMYAGDKLIAAEFLAGRFDDFVDPTVAREPCAGVVLEPFPELEQLAR